MPTSMICLGRKIGEAQLELSERTYQRGVRELLEKEFLFRSPSEGVFFVNIRYMFNGDRLAFVKTYHLRNAPAQRQPSLEPLPSLLRRNRTSFRSAEAT